MDRERVTVQVAASRLGVTEQAIRKRIKRGTIPADTEDGRVYVYLDAASTGYGHVQDEVTNPASGALISEMQARIESLERSLEAEREANRENRRLLAAALERVPELEGTESPERQNSGARSDSEAPDRGTAPPERETGTQRRSLWSRLLGR